MKAKTIAVSLLAALFVSLLLAGCGGRNAAEFRTEDGIDLDLTRLSSTMVYAEVFNMRYEPDGYYGKVVRMEGYFSAYQNPYTGEYYYNCVVPDATACCSQGLEFVRKGDHSYPGDYPKVGEPITVGGVFGTYDDNGQTYCRLSDAELAV